MQGVLLLAVLVVTRNQLSRAALSDILWGEQPPPGWNAALSSLTSKLRNLLSQVGIDRDALITSVGTLELVLPPGTWVDLEAATQHLDRAKRNHVDISQTDTAQTGTALPDATAAWSILQRPFLVGTDSPWVDEVRRDVNRLRYESCEVLSIQWLLNGDPGLALTMAESAITLDPLRETGYRLAIKACLANDDRALAAQVLANCRRTFQAELAIEPSSETLALLDPTSPKEVSRATDIV